MYAACKKKRQSECKVTTFFCYYGKLFVNLHKIII